ncbi:hypothetical protein M3C01_11370 [Micrococcus luteus]|nr:hypothetical protein [Micrococcus luteus]
MSKHIYSAGSLRAALRAGSLAARVSPNRGPVHLEVLQENALRVISTHEDAYSCAYADSDRPATAALAGLPPVVLCALDVSQLMRHLDALPLPETPVNVTATADRVHVDVVGGRERCTFANLATPGVPTPAIPQAPGPDVELPALPATLGLPGLLTDVLSGGGRLHGTRYLSQRIHGVPGALDLIGWSIGTWAHGRAYVAPMDGYAPAAREAAALADRDSLAALPAA